MNIRLIRPSMEYMSSFKKAIKLYNEFDIDDFSYPNVSNKIRERIYIRNIKKWENGIGIKKNQVPYSVFWLVDDSNFIGEGHIRHYLNENLKNFGGNIGYSIRPDFWGNSFGYKQLELLLIEAKKIGLKSPILTCYEDNIPSIKIIEKSGGILIKRVYNKIKNIDKLTRIYKICL